MDKPHMIEGSEDCARTADAGSLRLRIAYHNPWTDSAENQGFMSMAEAGRRIGIELIACADEKDITACRPDFVLSVATSMAKITDFPTYLTVHEPKAYLLEQPQRIRNLLSYDGYLTVSDSLVRFVKDFCAGVNRVEEPGFCYLTPQKSDLRCDWQRPDRGETLRVVYFGTNWNSRMPVLFRALDPMGILRIHGPQASWKSAGYASYAGPMPFDGVGPQRAYADYGIGLALMDERWQREDVISNRIFEISSVGAVSICPDMPWTRKWFGDSVLYYDPDRPMREVADHVRAHHAFCRSDPVAARQMGEAARRIFEQHFAAERMLQNTVAYHVRKMSERAGRIAAMAPVPRISVVLRCGGRSLDTVRRAVDSIRGQTFGAFTVILARYRDIDLSPITSDVSGAIEQFVDFHIPDGGRAEMMFGAIGRVDTPYFAVLDDDDFWLSNHFETLFEAGRRVREDFDMAFSGVVDFDSPVRFSGDRISYRTISRFGYANATVDALDVQNAIGINAFVARTDLLAGAARQIPDMRTGEDSLLICLLAWRSKPIFSFRATAFYRRDAPDGSNWANDEQRREDELSFALRSGLSWSPDWLAAGSFSMIDRSWANVRTMLGRSRMGEYIDRLSTGDGAYRVPHGILAPAGAVGQMCCGPFIKLPPGRYMAVFLILVETAAAASAARDAIGQVDVAAPSEVCTLAAQELGRDSQEIVLNFAIDDAMADWRIEFRVFSSGRCPFTVTSVGLHRDLTPAAQGAATRTARRIGPRHADNPAVEELRAQIAALQSSTSWRLTAPLRWIVEAARGRRG